MQQLNPSEISDIIKQRIESLDVSSEAQNEGTIVSVTDGIVRIHGLADVMYGEMVEFDGGVYGMALNLERDSVGAIVLGDYLSLQEGQKCRSTGRILEVPIGPELQGRVVNALGAPIDGKGAIETKLTDAVEKIAPGVIWRKSVDQPVQLGLKCVDAMVPIGRGQRELIIGDRQIGRLGVVGSNDITAEVIEASYVRFLAAFDAHLQKSRFLLGDRPASSDFGVLGQMTCLALFDPTPAAVTITLLGFRSRCTTRFWCANCTASLPSTQRSCQARPWRLCSKPTSRALKALRVTLSH